MDQQNNDSIPDGGQSSVPSTDGVDKDMKEIDKEEQPIMPDPDSAEDEADAEVKKENAEEDGEKVDDSIE